MYNIKRISIFIFVALAIALIASSFTGEDIIGRAIIIGMGVDGCDEGVRVTVEIVSPASSGEQIGTFSKTITANGRTIADAIARIAELTGKEASLGRCLIIVFGQEYCENNDLTNDIDYLIQSDSFKESSAICCVEGKAEEMFNKSAAMSQGVSLVLGEMFGSQAGQKALVSNTLLDYTLSQRGLTKTGFLNMVKFVPSDNENVDEPNKAQGYFDLRSVAVFASNKYLCRLTDEEINGFVLLDKEVIGSSFVCRTQEGKEYTVTINSKDVKLKLGQDDVIRCELSMQGRSARTDSGEVEGTLVAQNQKELPKEVVEDVIAQATKQIDALLDKQRQYNFDLVNLHETFRRRDGSSKELDSLPTADITVELTVKFNEK